MTSDFVTVSERDRLREINAELLAALELLMSYEPGGTPPITLPRGLALDRARAAIAKARQP